MTPLPPAAPVDLDEFRLVRVLGHGGMGSVYLGHDTVLERDVAIKLLRDRADDDARLRFLTEARAIARLDHPNVIAIFRAGTTRAGHPYLVQELVRGKSLDRLALPVAPERALAIGLGIARGLATAHRRGILHRDVKPANVMLDEDGTPKLLDFGVAKLTGGPARPAAPAAAIAPRAGDPDRSSQTLRQRASGLGDPAALLDPGALDPPRAGDLHPHRAPRGAAAPERVPEAATGTEATLDRPAEVAQTLDPPPAPAGMPAAAARSGGDTPETVAGAMIGTPRYMAPEIWRGEPATARSDLYSLGALLYELATGAPPYAQADRAALEAAVLDGPPPRPVAELAPAIDPELAEIITACLARDPAGRPASADDIAYRLEPIVQRRLRTRLAAAADDWRRLGRRRDALWSRAQLDEAARLDELSDAERAFLAASRAAVRRRRWAGIALAASLPAVAIATGLALRQRSRAEREREVDGHLVEAARRVGAARVERAAAVRDRGEAFRWFDAYRDDRAEPAWSTAQAELAAARAAYATAVRELEVTLLIDNARGDVRARIAGALFDQAQLAELAGDRDATRELEARLAAFDPDGARTAAWREPAALAIDAPGAVAIAVRGYADHGDRLELAAPIAAANGSRLETRLPPGSYSIELRGGDGLVVRDPVLVTRGESLALSVPLPRAADVPPGMVYVPPGRFLIGDGSGNEYYRKTFLLTSPLHAITTGAYLIAATEVTFGDWMVYLRALPPAERDERRPQVSSDNGGSLRLDGGRRPDEPFTLTLQPTIQPLVAREGEPLVYPGRTHRKAIRWEAAPVGGISLEDARAYTAWLAATGRVPGARLCNEREWERAARGADGRRWAHGNRIEPDDADIDVTYGRKDDAYGPDEVGAHPASTSPFGLADTAGNMWEWVVPAVEQAIERAPGSPELALLRGGCWYQGGASAEVANRDVNPTRIRWTWSGLRICATPR